MGLKRAKALASAVAARLGDGSATGRGMRFATAAPPRRAEASFETSDGRVFPVLADYRYRLKPTWLTFAPLAFLDELGQRGLLDDAGRKLFLELRGTRTVTASVPEMLERVQPWVERHGHLLHSPLSELGKRLLTPTADEVTKRVAEQQKQHTRRLRDVAGLGAPVPQGGRSLEIGFISGGESIIAMERLGYDAVGIDYFYEGTFEGHPRYKTVSELAGSKAEFVFGDVTKRTQFADASFDYIVSREVLEHIPDLDSAFAELFRLLKPGAVMDHIYAPFFAPIGPHSFGILDLPWGHVRMSEADFERYIRELRPYEADYAIPWLRDSLHRLSIRAVLHKLLNAGFELLLWRRRPVPAEQEAELTSAILHDALDYFPELAPEDLTTVAVRLVARKPLAA